MRIQPSLRQGANRTGLSRAHDRTRRDMVDPPRELAPARWAAEGAEEIGRVRVRYARAGLPIGTLPTSPRSRRELLQLFDLMGARLQLERTATRLYDALLSKYDAFGSFDGGPRRGDLDRIRDEELAHVHMLEHAILELGADPTVVTPSADRQWIVGRGVAEVITDPRTGLLDGIEALVVAELADHEEWISLVDVARDLERDGLVHAFQSAQLTEEEHLSKVRRWVAAGRAAARAQLDDGW